jgi:uncharacterized protein with PIN domain
MAPEEKKLIQLLTRARELYREMETAGRLLGKTPTAKWSQETLQRFQQRRQELFTSLEEVNQAIHAVHQQFPVEDSMPPEAQALVREQLELIELIQESDRRLLERGQALQQQLAPLLKNINTHRELFKEYQPEDKNPPAPRFFKATV